MQLTVMGPGCTRCKTLAQNTEQAAKELGVSYEMNKVVMMTPALAVNGTIKVAGRVPSVEEIKKLLA